MKIKNSVTTEKRLRIVSIRFSPDENAIKNKTSVTTGERPARIQQSIHTPVLQCVLKVYFYGKYRCGVVVE